VPTRIATMSSARQPDAARAGWTGAGRDSRVAHGEHLGIVLPSLALAGVAAAAFLWRSLSWAPAVRVDGWAYAAWGHALLRGERPLFELGATTPKPLAALIGVVAVPLPPERALALVAALALASVAASLFAAAYREAGVVAAAVAVASFAIGVDLDVVLAFGYIDAVVAALILAGVALRGRLRIAALVLAGLLRPEAWLVAAIAGFLETAGSMPRRIGAAVAAGAIAPALWVLSDLILLRDPLGTLHWQRQRRREVEPEEVPWIDVPGEFWGALTDQASALLVIAGLLGLVLHHAERRRGGSADALPLLTVAVWTVLLALQGHFGGVSPRYLLPVVALAALGCGFLAARILPSRLQLGSPWLGVGVAALVLVVMTLSMGLGRGVPEQIDRNAAIAATRPAIESALSCGRLGVARRIPARDLIPQLAASSRRSMYEFGIYRAGGRFGAVLHRTRRIRAVDPVLPPWPRRETPLGPLAVAPGCNLSE
jgi:hypothetical protein